MASLFTESNGSHRIQFMAADGTRRGIRLGNMPQRLAEGFLRHVDGLIAAKLSGQAVDAETSAWLGKLDARLYQRLVAAGLAEPRESVSLDGFLCRLFDGLTVKPSTLPSYGNVRRNLLAFFGGQTPLRSIRPSDADRFRAWLSNDQKLSPATVARRIIAARQFWRTAVRWELADRNIFEGVKRGSQANELRKHFVSREVIGKVLDACPDTEWRLIIAMSRYGGIRVPSELLPLKWTDIDWAAGTIRVTSPKTECHVGGGSRLLPLFAELRPYLLSAFEAAPDGAEYIVGRYRATTQNLRTQFERIIARAGVALWPKPFHNLRASRESELMRQYDLSTACRWLGNSPEVAARHYATSVDLNADFRRAIGPVENSGEPVVQKAVQQVQEPACISGRPERENPAFVGERTHMHECTNGDMGDRGFEPLASCVSCMRSNQLS